MGEKGKGKFWILNFGFWIEKQERQEKQCKVKS
jgi:hypothetical protein